MRSAARVHGRCRRLRGRCEAERPPAPSAESRSSTHRRAAPRARPDPGLHPAPPCPSRLVACRTEPGAAILVRRARGPPGTRETRGSSPSRRHRSSFGRKSRPSRRAVAPDSAPEVRAWASRQAERRPGRMSRRKPPCSTPARRTSDTAGTCLASCQPPWLARLADQFSTCRCGRSRSTSRSRTPTARSRCTRREPAHRRHHTTSSRRRCPPE
jgi:hypothetical protein